MTQTCNITLNGQGIYEKLNLPAQELAVLSMNEHSFRAVLYKQQVTVHKQHFVKKVVTTAVVERGNIMKKQYNIAVAGTGYVGLSIATLLAQHHKVTAVDIIPEKVELINNRKSPIQDDYIEKYLAEKELNLTATLDAKAAYQSADFVVIAAPTNYNSRTQHFDTSAVEAVIRLVMEVNRLFVNKD